MKKTILLIVSIVSLLACAPEKKTIIADTPGEYLDSITALYFNSDFLPIAFVECDSITIAEIPDFKKDYHGVLPSTITDSLTLADIKNGLDTLQPAIKQFPIDARIKITAHYNNGYKESYCLDGLGIYKDGILQQVDNQLLFLIKNNIGFYSWFQQDELDLMPELQDTTFAKEPFIISPYYKYMEEYLNR